MDSKIKLVHDDLESDWLYATEGVKQGCPLSSILFALYIADLEARLMRSGRGFQIAKKGAFWNVRESKHISVPGLLLADDLCLLGRNRTDIQALLTFINHVNLWNRDEFAFQPQEECDSDIFVASCGRLRRTDGPG